MAVMTKRTRSRAKCTCISVDKGDAERLLCFRKNFTGALDVKQVDEFCDMSKSTIYDAESIKAVNIARTMRSFGTGVKEARYDYWKQEDFPAENRMENWREKVSEHTSAPAVVKKPCLCKVKPYTPPLEEITTIEDIAGGI
jgi:hypothetical protein